MAGELTTPPNQGNADQLERLSFALQAAEVGTWDLDILNQSVWWDNRCKELYGFHQDDVVPYNQVLQYMHPDDMPRVNEAVQWALNPQSSGRYDSQFRTIGAEDGQLRWLHCQGRAFFDDNGVAYRFSGTAQDITQLVRTRQQLEASERRFRNLVTDSPTATVVFTGREMTVLSINEPMLNIWGKDASVVGKSLTEAMPELMNQPFLNLLQRVFDTGESYRNPEGRANLVVDGQLQEFWFSFSYNPLYDEDGSIYGVINTATDITERLVARRQIEASRNRQTFLLTLSDQIRLLADPMQIQYQAACLLGEYLGANRVGYAEDQGDGETIVVTRNYVNGVDNLEGRYQYVDYGPALLADFVVGRTVVRPDIAHDPTLTQEEKEAHRVLQLGATVNKPLVKDGRLLAVMFMHYQEAHEWSADELTLLEETAERTWEAVERARIEVTLRRREEQYRRLSKELEERVQLRTQELETTNQDLKRSNDNLKQFAYVASHDLQEPLRKIQSFSSLLGQQLDGQLTETSRDYIQRIISAGARMSLLIKDLLAYSRIATRQQAFEPVSLDDIVANVLNTLDWEISQREAQIEVGNLPVVKGDTSQLGQLFQNLLSNAIKFTPIGQKPHIQVVSLIRQRNELPAEVRPTSDALAFHQINVRDEGIGFDNRYLDRIFQVFQRLHGKNEFPGSGVGLAICQRVVENHGGGLTADSKPGKGATFCVYLPA